MITVIITVWKRTTLVEQINALLKQTIKPIRIWIYHCGEHMAVDMSILNLSPIIEYQYNTGNLGYFGRFSIAVLCDSKYIYILDDDVIPSSTWLETCVPLCEKHLSIISSSGRIIPENDFFPEVIKDAVHFNNCFIGDSDHSSSSNICIRDTFVDFGCNSWFLKTEWLCYFWSIKPSTFLTGEDIHLSASCIQKAGIRTLVPHQDGTYITGNLKKMYGFDNFASWKNKNFHSMRKEVFEYWILNHSWVPMRWTSLISPNRL